MGEVNRSQIESDLRTLYGNTITRKQLIEYRKRTGVNPVWIRRSAELRISRGVYRIPGGKNIDTHAPHVERSEKPAPMTLTAPAVEEMSISDELALSSPIHATMRKIRKEASLLSTIPDKDPAFVPFGDFDLIRTVVESDQFLPVFITGLSGNGKTMGVEQACALSGREYIRVNITQETDEDDLIGGFRLINGNTVFELGPVVVAYLRGAKLLLDELDLGGSKVLCLQPVLEGRAITIKKLGITITPTKGFNVFATANTKGRGDESGKFVGRFPVTIEQAYPSVAVEKKILMKHFEAKGYAMTDHARVFFDTLAKWADQIRATYVAGGCDDLIATRRLCHIATVYGLFGYDDAKALTYCCNRFDAKTRDAWEDLYNRLAPDAAAPSNVGSLDGAEVNDPDF
jgi:hypothetical protein